MSLSPAYAVFFFGISSLLLGLLNMVWVPAVQIRRLSRALAGRPELLTNAMKRLFEVYGWRARVAVKLFRIPLPPGVRDL